MSVEATHDSDPAADPVLLTRYVILGSLTLPGHPRHVREARELISRVVGDDPNADTARLLTSELVTNAVRHSRSRLPGGAVIVVVAKNDDGLLIIVVDDGSKSGLPAVRNGQAAGSGNGLLLVEALANAWGYLIDDGRTIVWFRLGSGGSVACTSIRRLVRERAPP